MRLLLLSHQEMDFLGATITVGAYENGHEVYEWPYVRHLHGGTDDDYILADGKQGLTGPPGFMRNPLPENYHTDEEILDLMPTFDFIIAHSTRDYAMRALRKVIDRLGHMPTNLILAEGEDHDNIDQALIEHCRPLVFFKRELVRQGLEPFDPHRYVDGTPVWPLQFGAFTRSYDGLDINDQEKDFDLFLALGITYMPRNALLGAFLSYGVEHGLSHYIATNHDSPIRARHPYADKLRGMLDWSRYIRAQAWSKITASMRGYGRDTLHAWEAFSFNTFVLYADPGLYIPHPFKNNIHCIHFDERACKDISVLLDFWLHENSKDRREMIAATGKARCRYYHSTAARFSYALAIAQIYQEGREPDPEQYEL